MREPAVAVAGAGPAGSVAAMQLARLGYRVTIFEKRRFPRPRVGESLTPGVVPLLDALDLRDRIDRAGFLRPVCSVVHWDRARERIAFEADSPGYQVDRARFDAILLTAALEAGARVEWRPLPELAEAFVIDASGRRGAVPGPRVRLGPPLLALYAYWTGVNSVDGATLVEAGDDEWLWGAPLPDGSFNATVFLDPRHGARDPSAAYRCALEKSQLLGPRLRNALRSQLLACDASCWLAKEPVGDRFIKTGEAAFTVDALSSQGVQLAMQSGWQAAAAVHTILSGGDAAAARRFYRSRQMAAAAANHRIAAGFYARLADRGSFWMARSMVTELEAPPGPRDRLVGDHIIAAEE